MIHPSLKCKEYSMKILSQAHLCFSSYCKYSFVFYKNWNNQFMLETTFNNFLSNDSKMMLYYCNLYNNFLIKSVGNFSETSDLLILFKILLWYNVFQPLDMSWFWNHTTIIVIMHADLHLECMLIKFYIALMRSSCTCLEAKGNEQTENIYTNAT